MEIFLILTLAWVFAHIIVGFYRFGIIKDKPRLKDFIFIDLIGTYCFMWICHGFACLVYL